MNRASELKPDLVGHSGLVQPIVTIAEVLPAANAGDIKQVEVLARSRRRERRSQGIGGIGNVGWSFRTW